MYCASSKEMSQAKQRAIDGQKLSPTDINKLAMSFISLSGPHSWDKLDELTLFAHERKPNELLSIVDYPYLSILTNVSIEDNIKICNKIKERTIRRYRKMDHKYSRRQNHLNELNG